MEGIYILDYADINQETSELSSELSSLRQSFYNHLSKPA